jgi:hypothetical protein
MQFRGCQSPAEHTPFFGAAYKLIELLTPIFVMLQRFSIPLTLFRAAGRQERGFTQACAAGLSNSSGVALIG